MIHGGAHDVEGERGDGRVHEDAEVVAQIGARDPERVRAAQHEQVADEEKGVARQRVVEVGLGRLVPQRAHVAENRSMCVVSSEQGLQGQHQKNADQGGEKTDRASRKRPRPKIVAPRA